MKVLAGIGALLLLGGCGSSNDDAIEPVSADNAGAARLMNEAEGAARNAEGRMSAKPNATNTTTQDGEKNQ